MTFRYLRLLILVCALSLIVPGASTAQPATPVAAKGCDVTLPNGETPPGEEADDRWYGSGSPDASLWVAMTWDDGVAESTWSRYDGFTGHALNMAFHRGEQSGNITLAATNATTGEPLTDERRYRYPENPQPIPGMIVGLIIVPDLGCWTITATDGNDEITWTMRVTSPGDCPVTIPNGEAPTDTSFSEQETRDWYGSGAPDASLWLMESPSEPIVTSTVFEPRDEGGHSIKTPFWRGEGSGPITLTGERLDVPSEFEPHIDAAWDGYEIPGFIATGIWYPTEGCWELSATDGNDTLTWTVLVRSPFAGCDVTSSADDDDTLPEDVIPGMMRGNPISPDPDDYYGVSGLYVTIGDPVRRYPIGSGLVSKDGAIFDKFVWYRQGNAEGELSITVENPRQWFPDEPEISVPSGYGSSGVQASGITFPGPGCWEVTGTSGDVSITFTVRYEVTPGDEWPDRPATPVASGSG